MEEMMSEEEIKKIDEDLENLEEWIETMKKIENIENSDLNGKEEEKPEERGI